MRIVLVCHYLPPHEGGIEHVVARLSAGYARAGHVTSLVGWARRADCDDTGRRVVRLRGWNGLERYGVPVPVVEPISTMRRLSAVLRDADAVHIHGLPYPGSLLALVAARRLGVPAVVTEHVGSVPFESRGLRALQEVSLRVATAIARRRAVAVVVLNERVGDQLRPKVAPVPILKIPNGVDTAMFRPPAVGERQVLRRKYSLTRPTVLAVGRHVAKKGFGYLAAAAQLVPDADVLFVGAGTRALADGQRLRAIEHLTQSELAELYRAVDLLALPSEGEGLPLVVQEAMASGLPVVMGDDPAVRSELPEGAVRYVRRDDIASLGATMAEVLGDEVARRRLATMARDEVERRYDWNVTTHRYLQLLLGPTTGPLCGEQPDKTARS